MSLCLCGFPNCGIKDQIKSHLYDGRGVGVFWVVWYYFLWFLVLFMFFLNIGVEFLFVDA